MHNTHAMKNVAVKIIANSLLCIILTIGFVVAAKAETEISEIEGRLYLQINLARLFPLAYAEYFGYDREEVLEQLPNLKEILENGLPILTLNDTLTEASKSHLNEMVLERYYSHISTDGNSYEERILATGYPGPLFGETLGRVVFSNYLDPVVAADSIFKNMFLKELDPERTEKLNILDPTIKEMGLSFSAADTDTTEGLKNCYVAVVNYGRKIENYTEIEAYIFSLINQIRQAPLYMIKSFGVVDDLEGFQEAYPEIYAYLAKPMDKLEHRDDLKAISEAYTENIPDDVDGLALFFLTLEELGRIKEIRERYADSNRSIVLNSFCYDLNDYKSAEMLVTKMLESEIKHYNISEFNILNSQLTHMGVSFTSADSSVLGGPCGAVDMLVVNTGSDEENIE